MRSQGAGRIGLVVPGSVPQPICGSLVSSRDHRSADEDEGQSAVLYAARTFQCLSSDFVHSVAHVAIAGTGNVLLDVEGRTSLTEKLPAVANHTLRLGQSCACVGYSHHQASRHLPLPDLMYHVGTRISQNINPSCSENDGELGFDAQSDISNFEAGFYERAPKRKQVYLWQCCQCGQGGNPIRYDGCRNCGQLRCAYCPVTKHKV